ncbi:hypothetical protein Tco_1096538 [Tanacetum coccineum]|uniref:Uncharacterized protein n=1 Tax=Tanacetum coccineum TaxID=301880 RepID=A0ABQ4Y0L0_9ASTR
MLMETNVPGLMHTLEAIRNTVNAQAAHHDILVESYRSLAWKVGPRLTKIKLNEESIQFDMTSLKIDTTDIKAMTVIPTTLNPTRTITPEAQVIEETSRPITTKSNPVTKASGSSLITLKNDKGKCIGRDTNNLPLKLVKASRKVCQYDDASMLIDFEIDGKIIKIPQDQLQAHLDKK